MNSMTGFGRAELSNRLGRLAVEISSLNNRFLDFTFRAPRQFYPLEMRVRELVGRHLVRGKISVNVSFEDSESSPVAFRLNKAAARAYHRQLVSLKKELKLGGDITVQDLLLLPELSAADRGGIDCDQYWPMFRTGINRSLKQLIAMRRKEGKAMARDMSGVLNLMTSQVRQIQKKTATSVRHYRQKLTERINELMETPLRDSVRLEEEIALFAEKSDITEEFHRLNSHIDQFRSTLKLAEPVGKRLNFLLQELNREVNTIGSKCAEFSISSTVISLKEEIEKLREMVQNAE